MNEMRTLVELMSLRYPMFNYNHNKIKPSFDFSHTLRLTVHIPTSTLHKIDLIKRKCFLKDFTLTRSSSSKAFSDSPSIDDLIDLSRKLVAKKRLCESFKQQNEEFKNSGRLQAFKLKLKKPVSDIDSFLVVVVLHG